MRSGVRFAPELAGRASPLVDFDKSGRGFQVDSAIVERAADLDLCLDFDIYYCFGDDEA